MGMESVYKLSVILNLVDNLSGQMNSVQSSVSGSVDKLNSAFGTMQKAGGSNGRNRWNHHRACHENSHSHL